MLRAIWLVGCSADPGGCDDAASCATSDTDDPSSTLTGGNDVDLADFPPVVIHSEPAAGALGVAATLDTLVVDYSLPMGDGYSWVTVDAFAPPAGGAHWVDGDTNALDDVALAPETAYHLWLNDPWDTYSSFASEDGLSALPWSYAFSTGSDSAALDAFPAVVVETEPVAGTEGVDPTLATVVIRFSEPLLTDRWSLRRDDEETEPTMGDPTFVSADVVEIPVELEPSTTYALWVNRGGTGGFQGADGLDVVPYLLTFRTADP